MRLESIGAEDIVDGNPRLILGLVWTIILRFQIPEIEIRVDEDEEQGGEKKSAKEALIMWCQRNTRGYKDVHIRVRYTLFGDLFEYLLRVKIQR